ncbi:MAG: hypothetical protein HKO07_00405 [Pseudomonadales bacterium]|nr:hypothetical protein [Pseudomonadales bacterium]
MSVWNVYLLSLLALCVLLFWLTRRWWHWATRLAALAAISAPLLLPVAVGDTSERAPAWVIAVFESAFGSEAVARAALLPLVAVMVVALLSFAVFIFVRRERAPTA